jgi:hypothetical protein
MGGVKDIVSNGLYGDIITLGTGKEQQSQPSARVGGKAAGLDDGDG